MRRIHLLIVGITLVACREQVPPYSDLADAAIPGTSAPVVATPTLPPPNPLRNAYFGDLHLHSSYSVDAFLFNTRTTPEESFRYAKGEAVDYYGVPQKRLAPLDFLALTDHAEYLGVARMAVDPKGPFAGTEWFKKLTSTDAKIAGAAFGEVAASMANNKPLPEFSDPALLRSAWKTYVSAAEKYNDPGKFTAFVAFEWTSLPNFSNLHRCVIFLDGGPDATYSSFDSQDPEDLWRYPETQRKLGHQVLAVPHNVNVSNGLMFDVKDMSGKPLTRDYAERRMANEPLVEIIQGKGQSETSPELSPNDEFADYEMWKYKIGKFELASSATGSYVRQAYGVGQELQQKLGVNPFKYGIEAGTDYHSGLTSTESSNYPGSHGNQDSDPKIARKVIETATAGGAGGEPMTAVGSGGLTGIWAEENTRASLFAAMQRKETFGTSGNRIKVRMFAGWNYPAQMTRSSDWVKTAYAQGVPMGGDLVPRAGSAKPTFVVAAMKDPNSGNLDRIQIVKVSTRNGVSRERVYDVVWSGNRKIDPTTGKLPAVGNTVDVKTAKYTNTIGSPELSGQWVDSGFDPGEYATYYARVLEIPTPRWSTYWAAKLQVAPNTAVPTTVQHRAWTSPIWFTPAARY